MGKDIEVAILFADVVGSTQLYEQLGDVKAREMVGRCLDIMREATEANKGTVIKTMGDEVMSTFPTPDDAMNAAKRMQEKISTDSELAHENGHVAIRIGCHFGPVVQEQRDIFGERFRQTGLLHGGTAILHDDDLAVVLAHERQRLEERPRLREGSFAHLRWWVGGHVVYSPLIFT